MKTYLVGGAVRDHLLKRKSHDQDYVVVGATPKQMLKQGFKSVGKDFPVFIHPKTSHEYALARKEIKSGKGHKAFSFEFSPDTTLEDDLVRRDFTINAMAMDLDTNKIIDPYNGQQDIQEKVIRHVSDHFVEDPLRVLRAARFSARFPDFHIHPSTIQLMEKISHSDELTFLSFERVYNELVKAFQYPNTGKFFKVLKSCGALKKCFPQFNEFFNYHGNRFEDLLECMDQVYHFPYLFLRPAFLFCWFSSEENKPFSNKIPKEVKTLAQDLSKNYLHFNSNLDHIHLFETLKNIDSFRNQKRFEHFVLSIQILQKLSFAPRFFTPDQIIQAHQIANAIHFKEYIGKATGKEIGIKIDELRLEAINDFVIL